MTMTRSLLAGLLLISAAIRPTWAAEQLPSSAGALLTRQQAKADAARPQPDLATALDALARQTAQHPAGAPVR